jgi:hypothetical protein
MAEKLDPKQTSVETEDDVLEKRMKKLEREAT